MKTLECELKENSQTFLVYDNFQPFSEMFLVLDVKRKLWSTVFMQFILQRELAKANFFSHSSLFISILVLSYSPPQQSVNSNVRKHSKNIFVCAIGQFEDNFFLVKKIVYNLVLFLFCSWARDSNIIFYVVLRLLLSSFSSLWSLFVASWKLNDEILYRYEDVSSSHLTWVANENKVK